MTEKDRLQEEVKKLRKRITQLERRLAKGEKTKSVLMARVERSIDSAGDPDSMFENNALRTEREQAAAEKKKLEAQLQQAQKMEAVGTLAGGIAHEFNNILSTIIGYTELVMEDVPEEGTVQANLQEVFKAAVRARGLVQGITEAP
jgi:C4-dicarboxylate-specific signal transduction histidine kinase